jgi:hypothetical protein
MYLHLKFDNQVSAKHFQPSLIFVSSSHKCSGKHSSLIVFIKYMSYFAE